MGDYEELLHNVSALVESLQALNHRAVVEYGPIVEDILRRNSRDVADIERTLDHLLTFCGYKPALVLYKRLCRHYWDIDPVATAEYVFAYRDMGASAERR